MKKPIKTIFTDIGGVLLTNGWDHTSRELASRTFKLNLGEMNRRHEETFDNYEVGKITLDEYLTRVVFYKKQSFSREEFRKFMLAQSKPYPEMLKLMRTLKAKHKLKIVVLSNEGRELNEYRIRKFKLNEFADFFISSSFVHVRKPDRDIYQMALDTCQVSPHEAVYIDDRPIFVQMGRSLGIPSIQHTDVESTRGQLAALGLLT